MSDRLQTKYESAGLFVSSVQATGDNSASVVQLHRVQSFSDSWDLPTENVNQFGSAIAIDRVSTSSPTPTFDFSYFPTNGINESRLGFPIDGTSIASNIFDASADSKNYYALFTPEGTSAVGETDAANHFVIALGNGYISSWDISASVGGFMEANASIEGSNYAVHQGSAGSPNPAIDPTDGSAIAGTYTLPEQTAGVGVTVPTVIRQGGIVLAGLPGAGLLGTKLDSANIQSFNLSVPFSREALERLGNQFVYARPLQTPLEATLSLDFSTSELSTGSLREILDNCTQDSFDFTITASACVGGAEAEQITIEIKGAYVESENGSLDVGSARSGSVNFTIPIGTRDDTTKGVFLTGTHV